MYCRALSILLLIFVFSCSRSDMGNEGVSKNDIVVRVATISESIKTKRISFGGRVSSRNQSEEVSLIQGKISKITVRSGEFVKKGQILASIAPVTKGLSYNQYKVRASISGTVLTSRKQAGSLVSENEVLFTIGKGFQYQVDVWGSIDDILDVPKSKNVEIILAPASDYKLDIKGELFSVSSIPDSSSGLYKIRVIYSCVENTKNICNVLSRNNVWARVNFERSEGTQLVLPGKYIPSWKKHLFLLQKDSVVKKKNVKFGPVVANGTTILEGLEEGDTVVVSYSRRPSDGEKVVVELKDSDVTK